MNGRGDWTFNPELLRRRSISYYLSILSTLFYGFAFVRFAATLLFRFPPDHFHCSFFYRPFFVTQPTP